MGQGTVNGKSGQDLHSTSPHHPRSDNMPGQDACRATAVAAPLCDLGETTVGCRNFDESSSPLSVSDDFGVQDVPSLLFARALT